MKNLAIWGAVAGAAAATAFLTTYKRKNGTRLTDGLLEHARNIGNRVAEYGNQIKDRLLNNVKGPNGENIYLDMYDRQFYEDNSGKRVYVS